jgi:Arc/MetJ-type ribon-helix-helix transcriptional regulator
VGRYGSDSSVVKRSSALLLDVFDDLRKDIKERQAKSRAEAGQVLQARYFFFDFKNI